MSWDLDCDSVVRPQDTLQVFERVKYMDADAPVEPSGLQQPQVFALMVRRPHGERRAHHFVKHVLDLLKLLAELLGV